MLYNLLQNKGITILSWRKNSQALLDGPNPSGMTPLHLSAAIGHVSAVKAFLEKGADPMKTNRELQLPIYSALSMPMFHDEWLQAKKESIFKVLLRQAPKAIKHKDKSSDRVFHFIAAQGFERLIDELLSESTEGAFHCNHFLRYPIHTAILNNQPTIAKRLIAIDKVSTLTDSKYQTALHYAACYGTEEILEYYSLAKNDIYRRDTENKTALLLAAEVGSLERVKILIEHVADVFAVDLRGYSLLHFAVLVGVIAFVQWVLDHTRLDINTKDAHGRDLLHFCEHQGLDSIAELLKGRCA